jgi:hypothetical protein
MGATGAQMKSASVCNGIDCESTILCEAHVIPRGFGRFTRGRHHNVILTMETTRTTPQLGIFDTELLCADCDNSLGAFDDVLIEAAVHFRRLHQNNGPIWSLPSIPPEQFAKGLFAILWRASLSKRADFQNFSLGAFENDVKEILFGRAEFADRPHISLLVQRYTSKSFDASRFYLTPSLAPFMGLSAGGLSLAGFRFLAKFDRRPLNSAFQPFDVTRCGIVRGTYLEIEKTPEFKKISTLVVADLLRSKKKTS